MTGDRGPAPGFLKYPEHRVDVRRSAGHWVATDAEQVLADTTAALLVAETNYGEVVYFPPEDVDFSKMVATDTSTTCPFKGEAGYFRLAGSAIGDDIAWQYAETFEEVAPIAGFIAFYSDRVDVSATD